MLIIRIILSIHALVYLEFCIIVLPLWCKQLPSRRFSVSLPVFIPQFSWSHDISSCLKATIRICYIHLMASWRYSSHRIYHRNNEYQFDYFVAEWCFCRRSPKKLMQRSHHCSESVCLLNTRRNCMSCSKASGSDVTSLYQWCICVSVLTSTLCEMQLWRSPCIILSLGPSS